MSKLRGVLLVSLFLIGVTLPAAGQDAGLVIVDDWPKPGGEKNVPEGWSLKEFKGSVEPGDISVESEDGRSVLRLKADKKSYFIGKDKLSIPVSKTPILTWRWKTHSILQKADAREGNTDDQPVNLYVTFLADKGGKVRALGYLWDVNAPRCSYISAPGERSWWKRKVLRTAGVPITWYIILRNAKTPLDTWFSESRDLAADYRKVFQAEEVPNVGAIAVQIDSATLGGRAESRVGSIRLLAKSVAEEPAAGAEPACKDLNPTS